jgi:hypothetical protein
MQLHITGTEPRITLLHVKGKPITYERHEKSGTYYHAGTAWRVRDVLEWAREKGKRVRMFYGNTETSPLGRDWGEECDTVGRIGRSMGPLKVPLLIPRSNSHGGGAVLDDCIVRIIDTAKREEVYRHRYYKAPELVRGDPWDAELPIAFYREGKPQAAFKTEAQAHKWFNFITANGVKS